MPPPLYAHAAAQLQPIHALPAVPSAPFSMNIHYQQAAARSGYDYGVVHIKYVVT